MHNKNQTKNSFKAADFFAGVGGIRLGFQQAGFECVFSNEIDDFCCQTYEANFSQNPKGDVTKINPSEIPNFEILLAGFPCQAFSIAGQKLGFDDTRGTLFFELARIIREKKPKAFLLENVKNLVGHDKGKTFQTILNVLQNDLEYNVTYKVLNSKYFGVPQNRERIYIVGFQKDIFNGKFEFPESSTITKKVSDILEKNVPLKYFISKKRLRGMKKHKARHEAKGQGFGYSILDKDGIAKAVVVGGMGRERNLVIDKTSLKRHENEVGFKEKNTEGIRYLTPREFARLQGYPDEFIIPVSNGQAYRQFGNSVTVPVINEIAIRMKTILETGKQPSFQAKLEENKL